MKETRALLLVGVVIAAALTVIAVSNTSIPLMAASSPSLSGGSYITGHVELILSDKDGNIKGYWQTDNIVTNEGDSCAAARIFDRVGGTQNACGDNQAIDFLSIGISNVTGDAVDNAQGNIGLPALTGAAEGHMASLNDSAAAITNSTGAGATVTIATPRSFSFSGPGGTVTDVDIENDTTITAVGLFDNDCLSTGGAGTGGGAAVDIHVKSHICSELADAALFAKQIVSVATTDGDTLAVTWTITVGG